MNSNFNKKKITLIPTRKFLKNITIIIFFLLFSIIFYYEFSSRERLSYIIQNLSEKFNYNLQDLEINSLKRVNKSDVFKKISKYYNQSIFLLPLNEISRSLHEFSWVKNVNLSTNFKNKLFVEIIEYIPTGLLSYNNQLFYFSKDGKVIDKFIANDQKNFIIFYGKQVLKEANNLLSKLDKLEQINMIMINEAHYINERRWDVKLDNNIILNLSEKNIEESINNYIKLIAKFKNEQIISIKNIDLRNNEKAIINFK